MLIGDEVLISIEKGDYWTFLFFKLVICFKMVIELLLILFYIRFLEKFLKCFFWSVYGFFLWLLKLIILFIIIFFLGNIFRKCFRI